jgi:hypothetical protein
MAYLFLACVGEKGPGTRLPRKDREIAEITFCLVSYVPGQRYRYQTTMQRQRFAEITDLCIAHMPGEVCRYEATMQR